MSFKKSIEGYKKFNLERGHAYLNANIKSDVGKHEVYIYCHDEHDFDLIESYGYMSNASVKLFDLVLVATHQGAKLYFYDIQDQLVDFKNRYYHKYNRKKILDFLLKLEKKTGYKLPTEIINNFKEMQE